MGRVFMPPVDNPFEAVAAAVDRLSRECRVILVDMHAEATAEKIAMGWHLDGRVTALVGTHTHVQTADARILPGGTAYITDVGMTGPHDSIIGMERAEVLARFVTGLPARMEPADGEPAPAGGPHRRRRSHGSGARASSASTGRGRSFATRAAWRTMSSLFDLPFDDDGDAQADGGAAAPRVYTVSELTAEVRVLLESTWADVWVDGEISNCRVWNTGHVYFSLKDAGAQLRAVMFKNAARLLKFKLEDGQHVLARGRISVYEPKGEYQIVCQRHRAQGARRPATRARPAQAPPAGRGPARRVAQAAAARAAAQDWHRHVD